ncbi:MAG: Gfo/Idh/MocA family oxidoreductase [Candidatus Eisenbacteria bacterium]|nr:Gfo/Idh/MocA family oxidoreductase [Candidatus Eisenbacteria bacterium]
MTVREVEPLPVAIVGCGHLGTYHARVYARTPGCRVVAVVDSDPHKAQKLAAELSCDALQTIDSLPGRVAAASIATPTTTHEEVALPLLAGGVDLLIEKPLAADSAAGARVVAAARKAGRTLAVGQIERCNPAFLVARRELRTPQFIESHRLATFVPRSLDVDVILDLMIHDLDLVLSLVQSPVEAIDAVGVSVITDGADIANARLRFADGRVANLTASRVSRQRMRKIRFFERSRYVSIDLNARKVDVIRLSRASGFAPPGEPGHGTGAQAPLPPEAAMLAAKGLALSHETIDVSEGDALENEIEAFLAGCRGLGPVAVDGEAGLKSLDLALQVRAAVARSVERLGDLDSR